MLGVNNGCGEGAWVYYHVVVEKDLSLVVVVTCDEMAKNGTHI